MNDYPAFDKIIDKVTKNLFHYINSNYNLNKNNLLKNI